MSTQATTATAKRQARAARVAEALAIFRERHRLSYDRLQLALWDAGYDISVRTLKRILMPTPANVPHATTLAAIETFLKNAGAPSQIKGRARTLKVVRVKPRRGKWATGSGSR